MKRTKCRQRGAPPSYAYTPHFEQNDPSTEILLSNPLGAKFRHDEHLSLASRAAAQTRLRARGRWHRLPGANERFTMYRAREPHVSGRD